VLFFILRKLLLKPVSEMLEKRRQMVYDDLDNAKRDKEEAKVLLEEHRQMLAQGKDKAAKIIEAGVAQADERREELIAKAQAEAAALLERAKIEIGQEQAKAVEQLRTEIASLSVAVAEKLLAHSVSEVDQDKIIDQVLEELDLSYEKYSS
jgi:F-type H+-transporting ATPase subunit b